MLSKPASRRYTLEYFLWLFTRLSAILMLFLGAVGIAYASIVGRNWLDGAAKYRWAFFPIDWHVLNSDIPELVPVWSNGFWRAFGVVLVCVAAAHGFNGLRVMVEDYVKRPALIMVARAIVLALFLFVVTAAFSLVAVRPTTLRIFILVIFVLAVGATLTLVRDKIWLLFVLFLFALAAVGYVIFEVV